MIAFSIQKTDFRCIGGMMESRDYVAGSMGSDWLENLYVGHIMSLAKGYRAPSNTLLIFADPSEEVAGLAFAIHSWCRPLNPGKLP